MHLDKEEIRLLNLNQNESALLNVLEKEKDGLSIQDLSKKLKTPRTSLYWPIQGLQSRGLVTYVLKGKRKNWLSKLGDSRLRQKIGSLESISSQVRIFEGRDQLKDLYKAVFSLHAEERVVIIEGSKAALSIAEKGGISFMVEWHTTVLEKKLIIESIFALSTHKKLKEGIIKADIVKSLARLHLWVGYLVPDRWIDTDSAILIFRDSLILADWQTERGVLINNREIVSLTANLVEIYKENGEKIDIVSLMRTLAGRLA